MPSDIAKLSSAYYPMSVFTDTHSADEEFQMWEKFRTLTADKKDILVSTELTNKIQEFEKRFQLQEVGVALVSFAIRKIFFGEVDFSGAENRLKNALASTRGGNPEHAKAIIEAIQKEVMTIVPAPEPVIEEEMYVSSDPKLVTVRLPLLKAMAEYKRISDQMITSDKIKLRNSPELVRPTLSNWIRSYREELGIGFHEPVQRGNFLFQTVNGKKLSNEDRAKLNLVLKSIEEQFPLDIDPKREVIVFPPASDTSMELAQVGNTPRPALNRFIQPRSMPAGTVRPAAFAPGTSPAATPMKPFPPIARPKPSPTNPVLANLKPLFGKTAPEKNISGETLHFSTGHVLPAERAPEKPSAPAVQQTSANTTAASSATPAPTPAFQRQPFPAGTKSPYSIRPLRFKANDESKAS